MLGAIKAFFIFDFAFALVCYPHPSAFEPLRNFIRTVQGRPILGYTAVECALPLDPQLPRHSSCPEGYSFSELPETLTLEKFNTIVSSETRWVVVFLCDGKPIPADKLALAGVSDGVTRGFISNEFDTNGESRRFAGGFMEDFKQGRTLA